MQMRHVVWRCKKTAVVDEKIDALEKKVLELQSAVPPQDWVGGCRLPFPALKRGWGRLEGVVAKGVPQGEGQGANFALLQHELLNRCEVAQKKFEQEICSEWAKKIAAVDAQVLQQARLAADMQKNLPRSGDVPKNLPRSGDSVVDEDESEGGVGSFPPGWPKRPSPRQEVLEKEKGAKSTLEFCEAKPCGHIC